MQRGPRSDARGVTRVNGIIVLAVLVAAGMGITGVYFHYKAPKLLAQMRRERSELPASGEGRVTRWLDFGRGFIDQRLVQLRFSPRQPWLVTHTLSTGSESAAQEIWGVDLTELSTEWISQRGMEVVVALPAPKLLGRGPLVGDKALDVPRFAPGDAIPDASERARWIGDWALERLAAPLAKDIPGARLVVEVGASPVQPPQ